MEGVVELENDHFAPIRVEIGSDKNHEQLRNPQTQCDKEQGI